MLELSERGGAGASGTTVQAPDVSREIVVLPPKKKQANAGDAHAAGSQNIVTVFLVTPTASTSHPEEARTPEHPNTRNSLLHNVD